MKGFDPSQPSIARVYDFILGGKDNFAADRALGEKLIAMNPDLPALVKDNRTYIAKATATAAEAGVSQFLDLGAGLPTSPAVHEIAGRVHADTRVVYVDNDPVVFTHAAALLPKDERIAAVSADLTKPDEVLAHPEVRATLDLSRPVCMMFAATMHFFDEAEAGRILAGYMGPAASGSWLALSIIHLDDEDRWASSSAAYTVTKVYNHGADQITGWLGDWELVAPGIAEARRWASGVGGTPRDRPGGYPLCAVATKP